MKLSSLSVSESNSNINRYKKNKHDQKMSTNIIYNNTKSKANLMVGIISSFKVWNLK